VANQNENSIEGRDTSSPSTTKLPTPVRVQCGAESASKMPCISPIDAWHGPIAPNGKRPLVFKRQPASSVGLQIACGQCIGCRLEKARQWQLRCLHEASLHKENSFLTLTYDDSHCPPNGSLNLRDIQLFLKRLRKAVGDIRFFQVGEYGERLERPHHHALIFGHNFPDKSTIKSTPHGDLCRSESLEAIWPHGFSSVGELTPQSVAYVTRYALKKITGPPAENHYQGRKPEYITMSRRPGIGRDWYQKFQSDVFPRDYAIQKGFKLKVPDYYTNMLAKDNPIMYADVKETRKAKGVCHRKREAQLNTPVDSFRLKDRETILESKQKQKKRSYENENDRLLSV